MMSRLYFLLILMVFFTSMEFYIQFVQKSMEENDGIFIACFFKFDIGFKIKKCVYDLIIRVIQ